MRRKFRENLAFKFFNLSLQGRLTLPHRQQLLIHTESCWDERVLLMSLRCQDERVEHVHSQELLTAELTSRSGWVRIIHRVQTVAATTKKTAGLQRYPTPPSIHRHSSHLARAESDTSTWTLPLPPTTTPDSLMLSQVYTINKSFVSVGWLQGDCESKREGFLRTSVYEKSSCWWYFCGRTLNLREWQWDVWSCRCTQSLWRHNGCETMRKVKQDV